MQMGHVISHIISPKGRTFSHLKYAEIDLVRTQTSLEHQKWPFSLQHTEAEVYPAVWLNAYPDFFFSLKWCF